MIQHANDSENQATQKNVHCVSKYFTSILDSTLTYRPIPSLSPLLTSPLAEFFYRDRNVSSRLDHQPQQPIASLRDSNPSPLSLSQPGHTGNRFNEPTYGLFGLNQIYVSDAN